MMAAEKLSSCSGGAIGSAADKMSCDDTPSTVASNTEYQHHSAPAVNFAGGDDDSTNDDAVTVDSLTEVEDMEEEADAPMQLGAGLYDDDDVRQQQTEVQDLEEEADVPRQLGAGIYDDGDVRQQQPGSQPSTGTAEDSADDGASRDLQAPVPAPDGTAEGAAPCCTDEPEVSASAPFTPDETLLIFDWDDTILPSTFLQRNGLRLDANSWPNAEQRKALAEVAAAAAKTMLAARRHGTVVLVTNAERGWIELSCQKFLPMLLPQLECVKIVSARTSYEGPECKAPLQWKLRAFAVEITNHFGSDVLADHSSRKNILSFGDSLHEREAVLVATSSLPNCATKALKFVERPDISQILKQNVLIEDCFERIVHHAGDLDLCIKCP